ncbi:hypothetical protein HDU78_006382 [Chytriomyces hyalinus]|nr:hypothetical protein HDU78_006382 [Chytriomyces hyalinus]
MDNADSSYWQVLLIDEAYNLNDNLYGKQVLDVLVEKVQGSENDDIAVLLCGYDEPMLAMLRDQNPGLASDSELMQLFDYECGNKKVKVEFSAKKAAMEMLAKQRHLPNFGNAGAVNLLIRNAVSKASVRQSAGSDSYLTLEDFGDVQNTDPMRRLEGLYRIDSVKASLIQLRDAYNVALKEGSELPNVTNFVFTGSPGTGKTTVARVMAEILFEMGILSTNRLVETSGLGLTGEYIGHTKKRVEDKLGEARGGVLFVDEAYELGKGHFSDEALTSIVASMTNPLYKGMVIILAGYAADIDQMMNKNVGLKSRFTRFFHFDDWTPSDSWLFLSYMADSNNYLIDDEIEDHAMTALQELIKLPGWGNGRDMTYIWKQSLEKRSSRVKNAPETLQKTLSLADISPVIHAMLESRSKSAAPVSFSNMPPPLLRALPKQQEAPPKQQEMMNEFKRSDENREVKYIKKDLEKLLEALFDNETALRNHGVSDEAWAELERSKQKRIEELERMRKELEELNRIRDEQERERKREEFEKKIREEAKKEKALQERIRHIFTKDLLETWIANKRLQVYRPETRRPALVQFKLPHAPGTDTGMKASQAKQAHALNVFKGTVADRITVCTSWNGSSLGLRGSFSQTVEKELHSKLTFVLKASSKSAPQLYAGISYLEALDESLLEAQLLLQEYLHAVQGSEAHPLLLLALARIEIASDDRRSFMQAFDQIAESNSSKWFWPAEVKLLKNPVSAPVSSTPTTPREMWDEMKRREGVSSAAMEELVDLIGLKKVKIAALELFKSAIAFSKMPAVARQKNSLALNFSFYGNPGSGKTTVAKLFSAVLSDCKLRPSKAFFHLSPRVLKDEGPDKFMETVKKAENGVMFIDEAYNLSPVDDPKGREIVNELLVVSEDMRDKVSIILAGYEDDMQNKLFSFNEGLKSRFQAIMFEDFDSGELEMIWNKMSANRKGFGNARDVRNKIEEACKRALARDDWDGDMFLRLEDVVGVSPMKNTKLVQLLGELDQRIGWASVKQTVKELVAVCEANYERELKGIDATPVILNRLFLGNPGTGKTTCAGIYAKILKQLNFLTKGELVVSTASDFVGQYIGQSQTKTNAMIEKARGNVLLIDEAYNLNDNLYGKQVLDVLVEKVQGSENDDIAVLLCGYDEPMLAMLRDQNPGLASDSELMQLFDYECGNKKVKVEFSAKKAAMEMLAKQRHLPNFGNAGAVNLLIRNAVSKASVRQSAGSDSYLTLEDFGDVQNTDPMRRLEGLYRIDSVKASLIELRDAYNVALKEGSELPNVTNFVFTGSPGTGKTTVARVMAEILFEMGILSTNRLVETSGLGLTGEYVGHTKKRVEEKLGEARGGVLFIDEAYELGKGHFSDEALTSIVASMTNPLYKGIVIILAGYAADIDQMMNKNVGLKSRFTRFFHFDDWIPSDSWLFLSDMADSNNYLIDDEIEDYAMTALQELIKLPGWGNGRDMTYIWKQSLEKRSSRVKNAPETLQKTLLLADISPVIQAMLETRSKSAAPVSFSNMPPPLLRALPKQQEAPPNQQERMNESKRSDENREVKYFKKDLEKLLEALFENEMALRDHGVSDEAWAELERSKQKRIEELERMRKELEELNRIRDEQERERKREEFEKKSREEAKKEKALQERIRHICPCPAGFQWFKTGNGWRCGGGSHFVSDAQLQANFTK